MAQNRTTKLDPAILEAALLGLEQTRQRLDEQIAEVRRRLGKGGPATRTGKRRLSAAARKRIVEAQRRRWAEYRKAKGQ